VLLAASAAAGSLLGRVIARDGKPLPGARIAVAGRPGIAVADPAGVFELDPTPRPPFVLLVARADGVAFRPVTVASLPAAGPLEVRVLPLGGEVTVVSGEAPDVELPPAAVVTVLGRPELERRAPVNLPDVLANVPGASASGAGLAAVPALRGLSKGRTLILLDGGRVSSERRAGPSATFLDPETVAEVEVVRGPAGVAYGSDAFGGLIRIRSRMPQPGAPTSVRLAADVADATGETRVAAEVSGPAGRGAALLGVHGRRFGDRRSPRGPVRDSGGETKGFRLAYQRELAGGTLRVGWRTDLGRDIGKPAPDSDVKRKVYPEESSHRLLIGFDRPLTGAWRRLGVTLAWDSYELVLDKERLAAGTVSRSDTDARDYQLRVETERGVGAARLVIGLDATGRFDLHAVNSSFRLEPGGSRRRTASSVAIADARRDDLGVFAALSRGLGRLRLSGGLRADTVRSKNEGGFFGDVEDTNGSVSGFLAATFPVAHTTSLTVQLARGFRDARLSDRFFRGETGGGFITGNPRLRPETSRQLDLALRSHHAAVSLGLSAYLYRISDLIERYRAGGDYFFRNRSEAQLAGVELEATVRLSPRLLLRGGAAYEHGKIRGGGDPVDDVPPAGLLVGLEGAGPARLWWIVRAAAFARKNRPGPSEQVVGGYADVEAGLGRGLGRNLELRVYGRNLLDRTHLDSSDENAVLAPGRTFALSLRARF